MSEDLTHFMPGYVIGVRDLPQPSCDKGYHKPNRVEVTVLLGTGTTFTFSTDGRYREAWCKHYISQQSMSIRVAPDDGPIEFVGVSTKQDET